MKRVLYLFLCTVLFVCCSKDDDEMVVTTFQGVVINAQDIIDTTGGPIEILILGIEVESLYDVIYEELFPVGADGTFAISVSSSRVRKFDIGLRINSETPIYRCIGPGPNCNEFIPGNSYSGITFEVIE